jgi:hypothetical protein
MWEGEKKCEIVGGRKAEMEFQKCKVGSLHKWQKVRRCTKAVQIDAEAVDYKATVHHFAQPVEGGVKVNATKVAVATPIVKKEVLKVAEPVKAEVKHEDNAEHSD